MDDELVEKVARGIFEARSWWMDDPRSWGRLSKDNKSKYLDDASAAIAVMREAGWKGPYEIKTAEGLAALAAVDGLDLK